MGEVSDLDRLLLAFMAENPSLLKELDKQAKAETNTVSAGQAKKKFHRPEPDYLVSSIEVCILCDHVKTQNFYMLWNNEARMFEASKSGFKVTGDTPIKTREHIVQKCPYCSDRLRGLDTQALVDKLLTLGTHLERASLVIKTQKTLMALKRETQLDLFISL